MQRSLVRCVFYLFIVILFVFIYCEWISYSNVALKWPRLPVNGRQIQLPHRKCRLKMLIVADPQLIGYHNEPFWQGIMARWDSDRYLSKSFQSVYNSFGPHIVLFLGDLFDEGSIVKETEFTKTLTRFRSIYLFKENYQRIFLPGDNDVGGESLEPIQPQAKQRFNDYLRTDIYPKTFNCESLHFFQANPLDQSYGALLPAEEIDVNVSSTMRILMSHTPLLTYWPDGHVKPILHSVAPHVILSAHDHKASLTIKRNGSDALQYDRINYGTDVVSFEINLTQSEILYELKSPTCNYRMGVENMGFGTVIIDVFDDGKAFVHFGVVWLPGRYPQLYLYVAILVGVGFIAVILLLRRAC